MSIKYNNEAEVLSTSAISSMITKNIQDAQKQMKDIQTQLKSISQHNVHNKNENPPNLIQQMNQSIELLLKTRGTLQRFQEQQSHQKQDNQENSNLIEEKKFEQLLCQNISNAYRRKAILLTYVMRQYQVSFDDIWSSLREAQKYNPSDPDIYQTMGRIIRMSGNIDLGITYLLSLTMTPIGVAPQIFISIAELLACRGLSATEKYNKRETSQQNFTPLSRYNEGIQQSFTADLHSYVPPDLSIPNSSVQMNNEDEFREKQNTYEKEISDYRSDEDLIEELLELLLQAPIVELRMQIRLWKELSTQKCLYGLERWKQRLENDYSDILSAQKRDLFFTLEHDDLMLKDALLFLEPAILEKRLDIQRSEPSRNTTSSNPRIGDFDLYSNVDQTIGDETKTLERIWIRLSDYWEGQEGLANLYLEQNLTQQARHWCDIALSKSSKIAEVLCIHACILLEEGSSSKHNMQYQSSSILDRSQYKNYTSQSSNSNIQDSIRENLSNSMQHSFAKYPFNKDSHEIQEQMKESSTQIDSKDMKRRGYDQEYREQQQKRIQLAKNIFSELSELPFVFASIRKRAMVMLRILELQIKLKR